MMHFQQIHSDFDLKICPYQQSKKYQWNGSSEIRVKCCTNKGFLFFFKHFNQIWMLLRSSVKLLWDGEMVIEIIVLVIDRL